MLTSRADGKTLFLEDADGKSSLVLQNKTATLTSAGVSSRLHERTLVAEDASGTLKSILANYGRQLEVRLTHGTTVYENSDIVSCTISCDGDLLSSVMRQAELELDGVGDQTFAESMKGEKITLSLTATADGYSKTKNFGTFIVKEAEFCDDSNSVKLTCYDMLLLSMVPYTPVCDFETPVTLGGYFAAICAFLGIPAGNTDFTNSACLIDGEKYDNGYTFRDVLTEIAQAAGGTIAMRDDRLAVIYPGETGLVVDPSELRTSRVGEAYGPVNSVVLARSPQEDNIYRRDETKTDWHELRIENNQLMDSHREDFIDALYTKLYGLKYYPYEIDSFGIVYLDLCDRFTLETLDGKRYDSIYAGSTIEITSGLRESAKLAPISVGKTDYMTAAKTDRAINKTILRVDKQEQAIDALVSTTTSRMNDLSGQMDSITKEVATKMTSEQVSIEISEAINGIDSVRTSTGYTFDKDGLKIGKSGEEMTNLIDNTGMYVRRSGDDILTANNEGVDAINLRARQYLMIGANSRLEDYETSRTACFFIG